MLHPSHLALGAEIAREQERVYGDQCLTDLDLIHAVGRTRPGLARRYRRLAIWLVAILAFVAALTALFAIKFPCVQCSISGEASALMAAEGGGEQAFGRWVAVSAQEPKQIRFSDGSMAMLAAGSRMRLVETNRRGASLMLESGAIELRVAGSRFTEYLVGVGSFSLTVAKGRVALSWDPMNELLELVVHEGYVVIAGCQFGPGRSVVAGKELGTRCITR